ncbi:MAG: hypothetical protein IKH70_06785 [Stomatobaculum sp.]|nr:hypothetical protein [Stomatobaculum sp.]
MKNLQYFPFERNQYYYGKLMTQQDFVSEQKYMNDKRRLINRFLHGTGVVSGLQVVRMDEKSFSVEAGLALDEVGREILVSQPAVLRLDQMDGYEQLQEQSSSDAAYLCIAYQEEDVYPSRGMGAGKQGQVYEKIREGYRLYLTSDPYEEDGDTLASMADLRLTIFENEEMAVTQLMPAFVQAGERFDIIVRIEAKKAVNDLALSFTESLICLLCDGKDILQGSWSGSLKEAGDRAELRFPMEAFSVENGMGELILPPYRLKITQGGRDLHSRNEIRGKIRISSRDTYRELVESYFQNGMNHILGTSYPRGIYLAKFYLVPTGHGFLLERVETVPFEQRVYSAFLNMGITERILKEVRELQSVRQESGKTAETGSRNRGGRKDTASGTCVISLGIGGKAGEKYFSGEIVHGLGLGRMKISLSLDIDGFQYAGSAEIFDDVKLKAELASKVNCERGSFMIGIRLLEPSVLESVQVRWVAERIPDEEVQGREAHIRVLPDKPEMKVMQSRYFRTETENLEGMTILWEVCTPNGGSVTRDGRYTAPDTEGIYEVAAFCQEMPSIRNSVFVIVRE